MIVTPILLFLALLLMKAKALSVTVDDWKSFGFLQQTLEPEYILIGLILVLSILVCRLKGKIILAIISHIILITLLSLYAIDTALLLHLNASLNWSDLKKYLSEWRAIASFMNWKYIFLLLIIPAWNRRITLTKKYQSAIVLLGMSFILAGLLADSYQKTLDELLPWSPEFNSVNNNYYSDADVWTHRLAWNDTDSVNSLLTEKKNLILVVIESLSAEDSNRTSGLADRLPMFDKLSYDGMLFDKFIANYSDTEGGLVSLLTGAPPTPFPGGSRNLYHSFSHRTSLINAFNNNGYHTEFLTTGPLSFLSKGEFLRDLGISKVRGLMEVQSFREAPKGSFDSPADSYLYDEALKVIHDLNRADHPYFLTLLTVTSHRPPRDPDGRGNNQDNVWEYVDRKLYRFYQQLKNSEYFRDGILIVTSDHRKMYPIPFHVSEHYGQSSMSRIPLVIIGSGIPHGLVDHRLFQQSDLLRKLNYVANKDAVLTTLATYVERYTARYTEASAYGQLLIINEGEKSFAARVQGTQFTWTKDIPARSDFYEAELHALRINDQYLKAHSELSWNPVFNYRKKGKIQDTTQHGIQVRIYKGSDIDQKLNPNSSRFLGEELVEKIDYQDIRGVFKGLTDEFSLQMTGKILLPITGNYWFRIESDDGAGLAIDQKVVIDADYPKGFSPEDGAVFLKEGVHTFELRYFQAGGAAGLKLSWKKPESDIWEIIPSSTFFLLD